MLQGELIAFFVFKPRNKSCFSGLAAIKSPSAGILSFALIARLLAVIRMPR
jgi:hypothetical protein